MPLTSWLRQLHAHLRGHSSCRFLRQHSVRPLLEVLEERVTPTRHAPTFFTAPGGGVIGEGAIVFRAFDVQPTPLSGSATTTTHPSMSQALISLFIDGASLETTYLENKFIFGNNFNIDNFFGTPDQLAQVRANAAAEGINYDAVTALSMFLTTLRQPFTAQADIGTNLPYAGPFATFAVFAGAEAALQAVQQS